MGMLGINVLPARNASNALLPLLPELDSGASAVPVTGVCKEEVLMDCANGPVVWATDTAAGCKDVADLCFIYRYRPIPAIANKGMIVLLFMLVSPAQC